MMRFLTTLTVLSLMAAPAMAAVLIGHNPNVNDGGLNIEPPGAWTKGPVTGDPSFTDARLDNNHNITPDDGGDWAVGGSEGGGTSPSNDSYYYQRFTVASGAIQAGDNDIVISGWAKAWAGWWSGEDWDWVQEAHIELVVDGTVVWSGTSSNNDVRDTWELHQGSGTFNVTDHIEVRLRTVKGNDDNGQGDLGAVFFDSRYDDIFLSVAPAGACPNPMTVISVSPAEFIIPPTPGVETLTITGANLDAATGLALVGPVTRDGTIVTQTAGEITATFDLSSAPLGNYALVVDRVNENNCTDVTKTNAVTIACGVPNASVATIVNDRGLHGDTAHTIRLTGNNLAGISSVKLRKSNNFLAGTEIVGTSYTMVGDDLEVTFDLTNAEGGLYNVQYAMSASCATVTPSEHPRAFLVYMPELTNGGFEEGYRPDEKDVLCVDGNVRPPKNPKAKHWDERFSGSSWGGEHCRDSHIWAPKCVDGNVKNITGSHYGGRDLVTNGTTTTTLFQTIAAPYVDAQAISTEAFNIRAELAANGGTQFEPVTIKIRLLDGTPTDVEQVFGEAVILADGGNEETGIEGDQGLVASPDFNAVVPQNSQYMTDPPLLTIAIEFQTSGAGFNEYYGFYVDNVRSGPFVPPSCYGRLIWADNNDDGMVDMLDFAELQTCLTQGVAGAQDLPLECICLDRNFDQRITEADVVEFVKCATGPAVPWTAEAAPLCQP